MIIDKKILIIAIAAVIVILALLGFALLGESEDDISALDILENNEPDDENTTKPEPSKYYRIVLASGSAPEVADRAREIEVAIEQSTDFDCGVVYDTQNVPNRTDVVEILIGKTNRNSSAVALEGLRVDDYLCKWIEGSLMIGGLSNSATLVALERFIDEIVPYLTADDIMSAEQEFSYRHDYDIDSIKLCDFCISAYSVVCSEQALEYARVLTDSIAQKSGYDLELDVRSPRDGVKEIIICTDNSLYDCAYIEYNGEDVTIKAADAYGLSVVFAEFYKGLLCSESDSVNLDVLMQTVYPYAIPKISVMGIMGDVRASENYLTAINQTMTKIKAEMPDVAVIGKTDIGTVEMLTFGLYKDYSYRSVTLASGGTMVIFYREQTVKVTLDAQNKNGLSAVKLCVEHLASSEKYYADILVSDALIGADEAYDAVGNILGDTNNSIVILTPLENGDDLSEFAAKGLHTVYNSEINLGDIAYRTAIMRGKTVACEKIDVEIGDAEAIIFFKTTFGKTCCASAQNIFNSETFS